MNKNQIKRNQRQVKPLMQAETNRNGICFRQTLSDNSLAFGLTRQVGEQRPPAVGGPYTRITPSMTDRGWAMSRRLIGFLYLIALWFAVPASAEDLLIDDFESRSYDGWTITGEAFGETPAQGTLAKQMPVSGFRGEQLINTFRGGDGSVGTATSEPFAIERRYLAFLIGGGGNEDEVGIELLIDGSRVRVATGSESEELLWSSWDVQDFVGKQARLRIYDRATGGWGHINVDQIVQTDTRPSRFDLSHQLENYRGTEDYLRERLRPQVHFSPEIHWMNDPNGLVYHRGEYHLFYQYNPAGNEWGHMSWGHAVSRDLVRWEHLPVAIEEAGGIMAFSGCCVVDHRNRSGFGSENNPAMVAIYTGHGHGKQVQNLAYSTDNGRTWTKYAGNPVLDIGEKNFRDPKVFWHPDSERWIMVIALAAAKQVGFYGSDDLKTWEELSKFGPAGTEDKLNWECPDLFQLPVENVDGKHLWVLETDMGSGSVAGGSGGEYFVGHFDGVTFTPIQPAWWVDFGRDFYAPVSWSNIPESDGRRIWIGWMNNWETCFLPTSPWRSCMSVPRSLTLRRVPAGGEEGNDRYSLVQRPVKEFFRLQQSALTPDTSGVSWPPIAITHQGELADMMFTLETDLLPGRARSCGFRIRSGDDEFLEFGYDSEDSVVYVDRRNSGIVDFHPSFPGRHEAPVRLIDGKVSLQVIVDRSSIEVFINDGEAVITDRFFPTSNKPIVEAFAGDATAKIRNTRIHSLQSIWHDGE
jgi:fructan beta-fructosidase